MGYVIPAGGVLALREKIIRPGWAGMAAVQHTSDELEGLGLAIVGHLGGCIFGDGVRKGCSAQSRRGDGLRS